MFSRAGDSAPGWKRAQTETCIWCTPKNEMHAAKEKKGQIGHIQSAFRRYTGAVREKAISRAPWLANLDLPDTATDGPNTSLHLQRKPNVQTNNITMLELDGTQCQAVLGAKFLRDASNSALSSELLPDRVSPVSIPLNLQAKAGMADVAESYGPPVGAAYPQESRGNVVLTVSRGRIFRIAAR